MLPRPERLMLVKCVHGLETLGMGLQTPSRLQAPASRDTGSWSLGTSVKAKG